MKPREDPSNGIARELEWSAVILWIAATIPAWAIQWAPFPSGNTMLSRVASSTGYDPAFWQLYVLSGVCYGAFGGVLFGLSQWFILREVMSAATLWAVLTLTGISIGQGVGDLLGKIWIIRYRTANNLVVGQELAHPEEVLMVVQSAVAQYLPVGLAVGLLQWAILRKSLHLAWLWPVISLVTWPTAAAVYWIIYGGLGGPVCQSWSCLFDPPGPGYYPASVLGWLAGGLVLGASTGVTIRYLLGAEKARGHRGTTARHPFSEPSGPG